MVMGVVTMVDTTREIIRERPTYSAVVTWLAPIIALAALVLAWIVYKIVPARPVGS